MGFLSGRTSASPADGKCGHQVRTGGPVGPVSVGTNPAALLPGEVRWSDD